jgi:chemotaxis protein histidine kinase CheA
VNKYTRLFIDESRVYLPEIAAIIDRLRTGCPGELDVREGQRLSHSMKGMALFEQQPGIAALTRAMERGFEKLSGNGVGGSLLAGLEAAVPVLARMIDEVEKSGTTQADPDRFVAVIEASLRGAPTESGERR